MEQISSDNSDLPKEARSHHGSKRCLEIEFQGKFESLFKYMDTNSGGAPQGSQAHSTAEDHDPKHIVASTNYTNQALDRHLCNLPSRA